MPEIKHQFTGGKMNKDLDERLVPNGEYRDALNIQVSTSEDSEVGTVQNILGNSLIAGQDFIDASAVCVGSIADEKNDKLYYFITNTGYDAIIQYDFITNTIIPVLVDTVGNVLKFNLDPTTQQKHLTPPNIITGINIIDDLLFWTDNESEPKKINIQRSIEGTDISGTVHTNFINNERTDSFSLIKEEHITVIKKAPKLPPTIELISERFDNPAGIYTGIMKITSPVATTKGEDNLINTSLSLIHI